MNYYEEQWHNISRVAEAGYKHVVVPMGPTDRAEYLRDISTPTGGETLDAEMVESMSTATHWVIKIVQPELTEGETIEDIKDECVTWWDFDVFAARYKDGELQGYCEEFSYVWYQSTYTFEEVCKCYDVAYEMAVSDSLKSDDLYSRLKTEIMTFW